VRAHRRRRPRRVVRGHHRPAGGPHRVRPRPGPVVARAARHGGRAFVGGDRRPLHDRHRAGDRRAAGGRHRGRRRLHRLHARRQHQPGGGAGRAAALRRRQGRGARARPAACRLVQRAGRPHHLRHRDRHPAARSRGAGGL
ncbi:MAG: Trk system potassium uptake protein TrkA, partial [uncultured Solirubrobacteraceae bacterium]